MTVHDDTRDNHPPWRKRQVVAFIVLLTIWLIGNPHVLLYFAWADDFVMWQDGRRLDHCVHMLGAVKKGSSTPMVWLAAALGGTRLYELSDQSMGEMRITKPVGGKVLHAQCRAIDAITRHTDSDMDGLSFGGWGETFTFVIGPSRTVERIEHGLVSIN